MPLKGTISVIQKIHRHVHAGSMISTVETHSRSLHLARALIQYLINLILESEFSSRSRGRATTILRAVVKICSLPKQHTPCSTTTLPTLSSRENERISHINSEKNSVKTIVDLNNVACSSAG